MKNPLTPASRGLDIGKIFVPVFAIHYIQWLIKLDDISDIALYQTGKTHVSSKQSKSANFVFSRSFKKAQWVWQHTSNSCKKHRRQLKGFLKKHNLYSVFNVRICNVVLFVNRVFQLPPHQILIFFIKSKIKKALIYLARIKTLFRFLFTASSGLKKFFFLNVSGSDKPKAVS